jgi:hypothetical protein
MEIAETLERDGYEAFRELATSTAFPGHAGRVLASETVSP